MTSALQSLANGLCPWLEPAFRQFEAAREQGQLGHAWLIFGQEGVGKLNLALVLAHRLLGTGAAPSALDPDVALAALAVRHSPADHHPDLHWLHPEDDKEAISIDQVRELIGTLSLTAHRGSAKVVIIEPAEAMTTPAANALLKTLEEPSGDSYLLLLSHRPGRLPATIRSRCQHLEIKPPPPEMVAEWLRVPLGAVGEMQRSVGEAPLAVAAAMRGDSSIFNRLESDLAGISEDRVDPQSVAQSWLKEQTELSLIWLGRRLHDEIRTRIRGAGVSTEVTVPPPATLHNAWRDLPSRTLFEQYDRAERLLSQLGSGINVELALQALLNAFQVDRGRT
jgi:DNA polymerase III subunit delta'